LSKAFPNNIYANCKGSSKFHLPVLNASRSPLAVFKFLNSFILLRINGTPSTISSGLNVNVQVPIFLTKSSPQISRIVLTVDSKVVAKLVIFKFNGILCILHNSAKLSNRVSK
jgi:hypothetical protein